MPFNPPVPRPLTATEVRGRVPPVPGIYGISNAEEWIYIGETENLQAALFGIVQRPNLAFPQRRPTGFVFEACATAHCPARLRLLVTEYQPACTSVSPVEEKFR